MFCQERVLSCIDRSACNCVCVNADFVLFSFAWVKPALGRFSVVTGVDRFSYYSDIFDVEELARDAS